MYIDWLQLVGRFHPVVLHLPIGLIIGIFAFELARCVRRDERAEHAPFVLIVLSAIASVVSVITGFFLAREGYEGIGVEFHRWLGIVTAVLAVLLAFLRNGQRKNPKTGYCFTLALQVVTMAITGHLGGVITHGDDFLTEPFRKRTIGAEQTADPYLKVAAIFEAKCVSCHNAEKVKGGLRMDTLDALMEGGDSGPAVVMGSPDESEILYRVRLPLDDDEHMPPPKKPQLTIQEIEVIRAWIAGAEPRTIDDAGLATRSSGDSSESAPEAPPPAAIEALKNAGVHCARLGADSGRLWIDFSVAAQPLDAKGIDELLYPLAPFVEHLSLSKCDVPQYLLDRPGDFLNVSRLDLRASRVTDEMLERISQLPALRELILASTSISDVGLMHLENSVTLRKLYVWNCKISATALTTLKTTLPNCVIDQGDALDSVALESESEVKLSGDAPLLDSVPIPSSLQPENSVCPVSGSPVNPKYTIVYEGKVIGFCCPNCPKSFWQDPDSFLAKLKH
jgi:uncharacterized membrane protein/mono/diheme cytochrome c family protein/YHS domain-containing protein